MRKFSKKQRLYLYQFCADMIIAGIPLYESLLKLRQEGQSLLGKSFSKKIDKILQNMAGSQSVYEVFSGLVPEAELSMIFSAEKSGSLANGFLSLVAMINYRDKLTADIIKAVTFPLIMLALALMVVAGYAVKVFPAFEKVVPISRWPAVTRTLYHFGSALYEGLWIWFLLGFVIAVLLIRIVMQNLHGVLRDRMLDRIVPFSTYKVLSCSVFLTSLSNMLRNNIPINDAIAILQTNASRWLKSHLGKMSSRMSAGYAYGDALNTGLLGREEVLNVRLYAGLPNFLDVLETVAGKAQRELAARMQRLAGALKSLSTLVLGGCVIWVFIAIYSLSDSLSKIN